MTRINYVREKNKSIKKMEIQDLQ